MQIRKANIGDVGAIMAVIESARQWMRLNGNKNQWINGYPSFSIIEEDIAKKQAFVCEVDNEIVGYFVFAIGVEPNYLKIDNGVWLNDAPYGVIHRLASNGKVKGIAKACFDWASQHADNIRVDTHADNQLMQRFLEEYGFKYCGIIYVSDGSPRMAYQL